MMQLLHSCQHGDITDQDPVTVAWKISVVILDLFWTTLVNEVDILMPTITKLKYSALLFMKYWP